MREKGAPVSCVMALSTYPSQAPSPHLPCPTFCLKVFLSATVLVERCIPHAPQFNLSWTRCLIISHKTVLCATCRSDMLHNIWSWFPVTCTSRGHKRKRKHESYHVVDSFDVPILSCMHKFQRLSCLLYFYSINTICPLKKKRQTKTVQTQEFQEVKTFHRMW